MTARLFAALLGLVAGIVTAPLALVAWPTFLAWFAFNESDEEEERQKYR